VTRNNRGKEGKKERFPWRRGETQSVTFFLGIELASLPVINAICVQACLNVVVSRQAPHTSSHRCI
jgi:hypothetical protein